MCLTVLVNHRHEYWHTHTHTHFCTLPAWMSPGSRCYLSSKIISRLLTPGLVGKTSPCASVCHHFLLFPISVRCHITSTQREEVPLSLFVFLLRLHHSSCFCSWWSGILCKCLNHWNLFRLRCSLSGSPPVLSSMSSLRPSVQLLYDVDQLLRNPVLFHDGYKFWAVHGVIVLNP